MVNKDITQYVEVREEDDKFMRLLQLLGTNILLFPLFLTPSSASASSSSSFFFVVLYLFANTLHLFLLASIHLLPLQTSLLILCINRDLV